MLQRSRHVFALILALPAFLASAQTSDDLTVVSESQMKGTGITTSPELSASGPVAEVKRAWNIKPRIATELIRTNNARLSATPEADTLVRVTPGVSIDANTKRLKGRLDMRIDQLDYLQNKNTDSTQRGMDGFATLEILEGYFYLDGNARINQQYLSAFGTQSSNGYATTTNQTETTTTSLSPYLKGHLGSVADYLVRYDHTRVSTASSTYAQSNTDSLQVNLNGLIQGTALGWQVAGNSSQTEYSNGFRYELDSARGTLTYKIDPQVKLSLIGGQESNTYQGTSNQGRTSIKGYGINWAISPRSTIDFSQEQRFFGNSHNFTMTHRTPLSLWRFSDRRDLQILPPQLSSNSVLTWGDYVTSLCSQFPTLAQQTACVNQLLATSNLNPSTPYGGSGSMTSGASVSRMQDASVAFTGIRNTLTLLYQRSDREKIGLGTGVADDFSAYPRIRQNNTSATWSHRVTHDSSLALTQNWRKTLGDGATQGNTDFDSTLLTLTTTLGVKTNGSVGVRRSKMTSVSSGATATASGYSEHAITATLLFKF